MAAKKQSAKAQKKKWFNLIASPELGKVLIGETPAFDVGLIKGRVVSVNMMALTREPKKQSVTLKFRVTDVTGSDAQTELIKYELSSVFVKRLVKKARDKIDDSFILETKDKLKVRIKPLLLTRVKTNNKKLTSLRMKARELILGIAQEKSYSELVIMILRGELQRSLRSGLKKIYPLSCSEIRVLQRL
ncbi:MAG: hypothetical protein ABIB71_06025 [Candidatus Woesearchaeota archaeon]